MEKEFSKLSAWLAWRFKLHLKDYMIPSNVARNDLLAQS